jgi:hypothetical protein
MAIEQEAFTAVCSWYLTTQECAMNAFIEHHKNSIQFSYRCFDRLLPDGLVQPFHNRSVYPVSSTPTAKGSG